MYRPMHLSADQPKPIVLTPLSSVSAPVGNLDRQGLLAEIVEARRHVNRWQARELAAIEAFAASAEGARGVAKELALELRMSERQAARQIALASALATRLPESFKAMFRGDLDPHRASKIAEPTAMLSDDLARKVDLLVADRICEKDAYAVRRCVNRVVANVDPNGYAKRSRERRRTRRVELRHEEDGMSSLRASLPAEVASSIYARVDRVARRLRGKRDHRTLDAIRADVFADLCLGDHKGRKVDPRAEVFIYLDFFTWLKLRDKPAEMAGHGQIPAWLARRIAKAPGSVVRRILTDPVSGHPIDSGRRRYRPRSSTDAFVRIRDRECRTPGCHRPAQVCDLDHVQAWARGGVTSTGNLCGLCSKDHRLKDEPGWHYEMSGDQLVITTPTGRQYRSAPEPLHDPVEDSPPRSLVPQDKSVPDPSNRDQDPAVPTATNPPDEGDQK
ncbi:HNH endonuclease signature motif containing protein [Amycolatopsis rhizosphaerae]|nr:HNH endonuclease signature motif containing protein [Amycolatopsis rhizosphaerae]